MWQGDIHNNDNDNNDNDNNDNDDNDDYFKPQQPPPRKKQKQTTVFHSILDVLSQAAGTTTAKPTKDTNTTHCHGNNNNNNSGGGRPISRKSRTKSARRKKKQKSSSSSVVVVDNVVLTTLSSSSSCPEMKQVLASIFYFLSWDCTLSEQHSVAAMGGKAVKAAAPAATARKLRNLILEHGQALQGAMSLLSSSSSSSSSSKKPSQSSSQQQQPPPYDTESLCSSSSSSLAASSSSPVHHPTQPRSSTTTTTTSHRFRGGTSSSSSSLDSLLSVPPPSPGAASSVSSVSFPDDSSSSSSSTKRRGGDPTAKGRRNRRHRKHNTAITSSSTATTTTTNNNNNNNSLQQQQVIPEEEDLDLDAKRMPPPPAKRPTLNNHHHKNTTTTTTTMGGGRMSFTSTSEETTTSTTTATDSYCCYYPPPPAAPAIKSSTESVAASELSVSMTTKKISQKLQKLLEKVVVVSNNGCCYKNPSNHTNNNGCEHDHDHDDEGHPIIPSSCDNPWVNMVCLESFNRIVTGKGEEGSQSCIEGSDSEEEDDHDESSNPILITNSLLGKSGTIPMLARTMSRSLTSVCQLLTRNDADNNNNCEDHCGWTYWHDRISILASLIDGACLFNGENRRAFCENDPFSFVEKNDGLVFHILLLLSHFCGRQRRRQRRQVQVAKDSKMSGIMLLALRTLTSLTHDNKLAAEQMKMCNEQQVGDDTTSSSNSEESSSIRGLDVLAELVFELEEDNKVNVIGNKKSSAGRVSDDDLHRFDSTIFCLNTLANIIEAEGVRRMLAEIEVESSSGDVLWLKWLCQWLVNQTDTFRDAILGLGKDKGSSSASSERELQKHEEDRLVAAGNGCVLLACLMKEPEDISEEPESTNTIRKLIIEQMPRNDDGSSTGVTMIINTLKAFCNFYHLSLGELSVAIVAPVKKLIQELEEL